MYRTHGEGQFSSHLEDLEATSFGPLGIGNEAPFPTREASQAKSVSEASQAAARLAVAPEVEVEQYAIAA